MRAPRVLLAAAAALALGAAPASAESGRLADFTLGLSSTAPDSPTGYSVSVLFHRAEDRDAKPSPLRTAVIELAPGLRFDSGALPQCTASDEEIHARGSDACPSDTKLTVGTFAAMTGFGPPVDPLIGDDHVFNGPNQLIEIITAPGSSASPGFDRLTFEGSTVTAHPPVSPGGPPEGETAIRAIAFSIPARTAGGRSLFTTPPDCPASGRWTSTGRFGFADGSKDTVVSATPCQRPALRLVVRPRRVRAGRRTLFAVRVSSSDARCVSGATVRLGGQAVRTDQRGRATFAATLGRPGVRRARATHPGCRAAGARVAVLGVT